MLLISVLFAFVGYPFIGCEVIHDPTLKPGSLVLANDPQRVYESEDNGKIIRVICHRTYDERMKLKTAYDQTYCNNKYYSTRYGTYKDISCELLRRLGAKTTGSMDKLYDVMFIRPEEILGRDLQDMIYHDGKNRCIAEVLCAQDNSMKKRIKEYYTQNFQTTVEEHIATYKKDDHPYQDAIKKYCLTERPEELKITEQVATDEANCLRQINIENDKEPFKAKLKEFFDKYTEADLKLIFQKYRKADDDGIDNTVEDKVFEGDEKEVYSILVRYIENTCKYYADALHDCMDGMGTDEVRINRIVVGRCEQDLACIHREYKRLHDETYTERLDDDTTEDDYVECIRYLSGKP